MLSGVCSDLKKKAKTDLFLPAIQKPDSGTAPESGFLQGIRKFVQWFRACYFRRSIIFTIRLFGEEQGILTNLFLELTRITCTLLCAKVGEL